ncbi:MAG: ABC transporter permease [Eubacterium sp.]|nr:ABC transporter permease [Eubacterium sp.]
MIKLALRFLLHYKMQSFAILLSIVLSVALLTGISSLVYSGHISDLENCREIYGDWNYMIPDADGLEEQLTRPDTPGYRVEACGRSKDCGQIEEDGQQILLKYADERYLHMRHQPVEEGRYPQEKHEIAMSRFTLDNLGIQPSLGETVRLGKKHYALTGILKDPWAFDNVRLTAYISNKEAADKQAMLSLKLDGSEKMHKQIDALVKDTKISAEDVQHNSYVNRYLGQGQNDIVQAIKDTVTDREYNFTYLLLVLKGELGLTVNGMIGAMGLFSLFIIYSIYQISISKRLSVYGILSAVGIGGLGQFFLVFTELCCLLLVGFPAGALLGNTAAWALYQKFNTVFIDKDIVKASHGNLTARFEQAAKLSVQEFHVSRSAVVFGFLFLLTAMVFLSWRLARKIRKMTAVQLLKPMPFASKRQSRISYSQRGCYMPGVVNRKFMFAGKRMLVSILVSLSIGGVIFLCTNFVLGNAKRSSELQLASDDGLGSDFKVYENNTDLKSVIPQECVDKLQKIAGVRNAYAVQSYVGELQLPEDQLKWKTVFDSVNEYGGEKWDGVCNRLADGGYGIKAGILGYDDGLLEQLEPYLLGEGSLSGSQMRMDNEVVFVAIEDAQGNRDGITIQAGDSIRLRVPRQLFGTFDDLKLSGSEELYEIKEFTVCAVVSRPLIKDSTLYHLDWINNSVGVNVIMTNAQMENHFGTQGYRAVGMELHAGADAKQAAQAVKQVTDGMDGIIFQDYTGSIARQKEYLEQKMFFFYSVAVMFFVISLFHIMNAMSHMIMSRKHEFGVLRAVGTSDRNIIRMMAAQGAVYGCLSGIVMLGLYAGARRIAVYFMEHIYQYLVFHIEVEPRIAAVVLLVNIGVGMAAVMIPAYFVLKEEVVVQLRE